MNLPGTSQDPDYNTDLFPFEHASSPNLTARRIYQNAVASGNAQAHYGDRIVYGDSYVYNHCETPSLGT